MKPALRINILNPLSLHIRGRRLCSEIITDLATEEEEDIWSYFGTKLAIWNLQYCCEEGSAQGIPNLYGSISIWRGRVTIAVGRVGFFRRTSLFA